MSDIVERLRAEGESSEVRRSTLARTMLDAAAAIRASE